MSEQRLMGESILKNLAHIALEHSRAEQTEVGVMAGRWALTRFANSSIHQNMASENVQMSVRAVFGKKVASASTNVLTEQGIRALVDKVVEMARLQDENPDFVSLPGPTDQPRFAETYSPETAASTPEERAEMVAKLVAECDKVGATAAGSCFVRVYERAVLNSLGVNTYFKGTAANLTTVVTGQEGGFGYASRVASNIRDIDATEVGSEAAKLARGEPEPDGPGARRVRGGPLTLCRGQYDQHAGLGGNPRASLPGRSQLHDRQAGSEDIERFGQHLGRCSRPSNAGFTL